MTEQEFDITKISNDELLLEVERQSEGQPSRFSYSMEWVRRVGLKLVKIEQLDDAMRRGYDKRWPSFVERFNNGELFGCQWFDFSSMLMASEEEVAKDTATWALVHHTAEALGKISTPEFTAMLDFAGTRISMTHSRRRAIIQPGSGGFFKPTLSKEALDSIEQARQRFDALVEKHGWWWATGDARLREERKEEYAKRAAS